MLLAAATKLTIPVNVLQLITHQINSTDSRKKKALCCALFVVKY